MSLFGKSCRLFGADRFEGGSFGESDDAIVVWSLGELSELFVVGLLGYLAFLSEEIGGVCDLGGHLLAEIEFFYHERVVAEDGIYGVEAGKGREAGRLVARG